MDNEYFVDPIIVDSTNLEPPDFSENMYENRRKAYYMYDVPGIPKCSIVVLAYNRLQKTKYCVECILKYVLDISYELVLVDNGSDDGTYEFFQSVPYGNKVVIKIEKNIGAFFGFMHARNNCRGKFIASIPNDVYLTKNALENLLHCLESDPSIGAVMPVSSNISGFQWINLEFGNLDEMQEKAALFNKRDPSQWEERMRLVSVIWIFTREIIDIVGIGDPAYIHEFGEDDMAMRYRRAGYKLVLCKDAWVHHDHNMEDKNTDEYKKTLSSGWKTFFDKYNGIDACKDIDNYEGVLLRHLGTARFAAKDVAALSVDVRCGAPVLEMRNKLRARGIGDVYSCSFTTDMKYFADLQALCDEVKCDRIDFIQDFYADNSFDIVICGEAINIYSSPIMLLQKLYGFLKQGGMLLFKLRNTDNRDTFLRRASLGGRHDPDYPVCLPFDEVIKCLQYFGGRDIEGEAELGPILDDDKQELHDILKKVNENADESDIVHMLVKDYCIKAVKG